MGGLVAGVADGYIITQAVFGLSVLIIDMFVLVQIYRYAVILQRSRRAAAADLASNTTSPASPVAAAGGAHIVAVKASSSSSSYLVPSIPLASQLMLFDWWLGCCLLTIKYVDPRHIWGLLPHWLLYFIETFLVSRQSLLLRVWSVDQHVIDPAPALRSLQNLRRQLKGCIWW